MVPQLGGRIGLLHLRGAARAMPCVLLPVDRRPDRAGRMEAGALARRPVDLSRQWLPLRAGRPGFAAAWRNAPYFDDLRRMAAGLEELNRRVIVFVNDDATLITSKGATPLGRIQSARELRRRTGVRPRGPDLSGRASVGRRPIRTTDFGVGGPRPPGLVKRGQA